MKSHINLRIKNDHFLIQQIKFEEKKITAIPMSIEEIIKQALEEDLGSGDHTSIATIPANAMGKSKLLIKEEGILAGVEIARQVYRQLDPAVHFENPHQRWNS